MNAVSLFSGCGGLDLGLREAGFKIIAANDSNPLAVKTYQKNIGNEIVLGDIRESETRKKILSLAKGKNIDVVVGGPPCQGFSTLGDKNSSDLRNNLFDSFADMVSVLKPNYFLMENVKAMTTMYGGRFKDYVLQRFNELGYDVEYSVLNAADYGAPQNRERVFFHGTKHKSKFSFPKQTHGTQDNLKPYESTDKWIMDLVGKENEIENHTPLNHSEIVIRRYKLIPEGGRLPPPEELPKEIRRKNFGNTYKRLDRQKPSLTMVPGNNAFPIHPVLDRSLTPREAARLQTFPDEFSFVGDRKSQCIQIGNAVPPLMGKVLGKAIKNYTRKQSTTKNNIVTQKKQKTRIGEDVLPLKKIMNLPDNLGFIDLFSGAGGFTIGFANAGWKPLLSADNNENVIKTHSYNFPTLPFSSSDLSSKKIREKLVADFQGKQVGVVVGGPPCQGFSMFGKRRFVYTKNHDPMKDDRNKLVASFVDVVGKLSPRWFVMENVAGLASLDDGKFLKTLIKKFKKLGYENTEARILNAADYGVPQLRKRLVIIGNRTGHIVPWPKRKFFSEPHEWQKPFNTVGQFISDLSDNKSYKAHTCHVPMNHKPLLVERYKRIPEGGKLDVESLPEKLKTGYRTDKVKNYSHIYKRLDRKKPSTTMVPGHNAFPIHPWLNRALTVREAARLQTFPDDLEFKGSRQNQCIQVGNAFPVLLAEIIGTTIKKAETNDWRDGTTPKSAYYSILEDPEDYEPIT